MADKTSLISIFPCPQKLVENPESDICVCLRNFHENFKKFLFSFVDILLKYAGMTEGLKICKVE